MYCNSCATEIKKDDVEFCSQCNVPLHRTCANHCLDCGVTLCDTCFGSNNFHCDGCRPAVAMFETIRRSHLEQYQACPYSLYLQLVKGVKVPDGEHAALGSFVHQLIDKVRNNLINYTECMNQYVDGFHELFKDLTDVDLYDKLYIRGKSSLNNFWSIKDLLPKGDFESEINIIFRIEPFLPAVSCTLDEVVKVGEEFHVSDWKTGKPMSGQKLIADLQPPLYIEGVKQKYGKYPKTFTLYYLEENKVKVYELTSIKESGYPIYTVKSGKTDYILDVEDAIRRTREILTKINNGVFNMPTAQTHEWYCKSMCYFYKSGICASTVKEQWKVLNTKYSEDK